jgi:predicted lipid-binding transport protein (Tim44 family)
MKSLILALGVAIASVGLMPDPAEARRFGGGGAAGLKRTMPPRTPDATPGKPAQAAPTPPNAAAAATQPKRSWMGPIAGLAAGLGLAALMSHLGLGEEFANILMMALLAVAAFIAVRMLMRRFAPAAAQRPQPSSQNLQFAGAGGASAGAPAATTTTATAPAGLASGSGSAWGPGAVAAPYSAAASFAQQAPVLPAGFDAAAFERIAKMIFVRMQAANDSADLNDLRAFTTPEMFASVRLDLQERGASTQTTDVVKVDAEIVDFANEADRQVVSVRFHGLIQEDKGQPAGPFDEIWHLVRPTDGSREWAIAGIQQTA